MAVQSVQLSSTGFIPNSTGVGKALSQQLPEFILIETNDILATVLATGYLNKSRQDFQFAYNNQQMALVYTTDSGVVWLSVVVSGTDYSLQGTTNISTVYEASAGSAAAPSYTFVGDLDTGLYHPAANQVGVSANGALVGLFSTSGLAITGLISATTTIAAGTNITAGSSGTAGTVSSFPGTALKGSLKLAAVNNTGDTVTTISNAAMGQATVVSIPDPGAATANFILSASGSAQTIAGGLTISTGNLAVSQGNVVAGSSGHQGTVSAFPSGAGAGSLVLSAIGNSGNTAVTISNAIHGQATVYSIPDVGAATGGLVVSVTNGIMKFEANIAVAGGAAAQDVTDAFITSACTVIANWRDTTNPVEIETVLAGAGKFTVTSTADPGASHIDYIVMKAG